MNFDQANHPPATTTARTATIAIVFIGRPRLDAAAAPGFTAAAFVDGGFRGGGAIMGGASGVSAVCRSIAMSLKISGFAADGGGV